MMHRLGAIGLAVATLTTTAAIAGGGPNTFTMSNPGQVFQGFPVTFELSGGPVNGPGAGLFVTIAPPGGPVNCPPQIAPFCLDLELPSSLIAVTSLAGPGPDSFTVTPPHAPSILNASLQAAAIGNGGSKWVSNRVDVDVVPTCVAPTSSFPAVNNIGIAPGDTFSFSFEDDVAEFQMYALYQNGAPVSTSVVTDGNQAFITPDADLAPNSDATLFTMNPCGDFVGVPFTTGNADAVGGNNLVDRTYVLDLSGVNITTPSSLGTLITPLLADYDDILAIQVMGWDGTDASLSFRQGYLFQGTEIQDVCSLTADIEGIVFDDDPNFAASVDDLGGFVQDATLAGSIASDGSGLSDVTLSAYVSGATIDSFITGGQALVCGLFNLCEPCPSDATQNCVFVEGNGIQANEIDLDLAEILAPDPSCPPAP